jgi:hypothetical protein
MIDGGSRVNHVPDFFVAVGLNPPELHCFLGASLQFRDFVGLAIGSQSSVQQACYFLYCELDGRLSQGSWNRLEP